MITDESAGRTGEREREREKKGRETLRDSVTAADSESIGGNNV